METAAAEDRHGGAWTWRRVRQRAAQVLREEGLVSLWCPWRYDFFRIKRGSLPPGESPETSGPAYWGGIARKLEVKGHYLDAFLGGLKRQTYLSLIQRWGGVPAGRVLKTDLFEEAMGPDTFLAELTRGGAVVEARFRQFPIVPAK